MTVVVIGTGLTQTAAALEFARYGVPVTIIEQQGAPLTPRAPEADPDRVLRDWLAEIGAPIRDGQHALTDITVHEPPTVYVKREDQWVKVPEGSAFGIPSSPLSTETMQALGGGAAFRAYLDRITPVLKIGKTQFVSDLVAKRVGRSVLDVLVEPQVRYLFGAPSSEVEVSALAPGLNEAETRAGSLTGAALAYADRYRELAGGITPDIGWSALREGLMERLEHYGAKVVPAVDNLAIEPLSSPSGSWNVTFDAESVKARVLIADPYSEAMAHLGLIEHSQPVRTQVVTPVRLPEGFPDVAPAVGLETFDAGGLTWTKRYVASRESATWAELLSDATTEPVTQEGIRAAIATAGLHMPQDVVPSITVAPALDPAGGEDTPTDAADSDDTRDTAEHSFIATSYPAGGRGLHESIGEIREHATLLRREVLGLS